MYKKIYLSLTLLLTCFTTSLFAGKIHNAIRAGDLGLVKKLIRNNPACVNMKEKSKTPLYMACAKNNPEIAALLLDNGAIKTVNRADLLGKTPLYEACQNNNPKIAKLLLDKNANPNKADKLMGTPLYWACKNNNLKLAQLLLDNGAKQTINEAHKFGTTPLHEACQNNNLELIKLLLDNGADHTKAWNLFGQATNLFIQTPLCKAWQNNNLEIADIILSKYSKATINQTSYADYSPLSWASHYNKPDIVTLLLNKGATPNENNKLIYKPLYLACHSNNLEMVKLLLPYCSQKTICECDKKNDGITPLYLACAHNNLKMVTLLLSHCTKETINMADKTLGQTPLYLACDNNNLEMVKLLLPHCSQKTICERDNNNGITPLYLACRYNNLEMAKLLLPYYSQKTICERDNINGITPLYIACHHNAFRLTKLLLLNGACISQKEIDKASKTMQPYLKFAQAYNNPQKNIKEKIKYIMSQRKKNRILFIFLIKLCFAKSVQQIVDKSYNSIEKTAKETAFFEHMYKKFKKDYLEKVFRLNPKNRTFIELAKNAIQNEKNGFYFATPHTFEREIFFEKITKLRDSSKSNNTHITPDTTIICKK